MLDESVTPLAEYPGYGVSRDGRAWSNIPMGKKAGRTPTEWRPLKGRHSKHNRYPNIEIRKDGRAISRYIHDLVLTTFVGPRPSPTYHVRHIDGCSTNNQLTNLTWGTPQEYRDDRVRHGTSGKGECNSQATLQQIDIASIRMRSKNGQTVAEIAHDFGISLCHCRKIIRRERWSHVE